jgi:hypothetical protein
VRDDGQHREVGAQLGDRGGDVEAGEGHAPHDTKLVTKVTILSA